MPSYRENPDFSPLSAKNASEPASIATKLRIGLTLTVLIISAMVIGFNQYLATRHAEAQLEILSNEYISNIIHSLELPLWYLSNQTVEKIVATYGNNESVAYLKVTNSRNKEFINKKDNINGPLISRTQKIFHGTELVGEVRIVMTPTIYQKANRRLLRASVINSLIVIAALILIMQIIINRFLRVPLKHLSNILQAYAHNQTPLIDRNVPIEFRPFIAILEKMSHEIRIQINALENSEKNYRQLFNNLVDVFFRIDLDGKISMVSPSFKKMFGYEEENAVGMKVVENFFLNPARGEELIKSLSKNGYVETFEAYLAHKDGTMVCGSISARFFHDDSGKIQGVEGTIRDITAKKKAQESQILLTTAIKQSADLVMITDKDGNIEYVNPAFEAASGFSHEAILGKNPKFLKSGKHNRKFYSKMWNSMSHGKVWKDRLINRKSDGTFFEIEATISPIRDTSGDIINYVSVGRDVTREVRLEKQIRQTQKMEAIGTLAGGIAHDFNNILAAIIGYCEIAMLKGTNPSHMRNYIKEVLKAGHRARDLVKHILTFSRQSDYQKVPTLIKPVVNEVHSMLRASLPSTIEIHKEFKSDSVIMADTTQIHQILMNLCTNAAHAMQSSGGELKIAIENVYIDNDFVNRHPEISPGPFLKLAISDTGEGMSPETMERIFDPFFTTKSKDQGTGMGLSVVHGIVRDCGGLIKVYSEQGKGTTFNIFLPAVSREKPEEENLQNQFLYGTERILFVDDESYLIDVGEKMLKQLGYQVIGMSNSLEAFQLFSENPYDFDLLITDLTMPKLSGDKLAKEIISIRPDIPIILCTGYSDQLTKEKTKKIGVKAYIAKPVIMKQMSIIIRQVLDGQND